MNFKKTLLAAALTLSAGFAMAADLPQVAILATGGTIAGTAASAHSSSEAAAAKTSASSETSTSSEATDKRTASAATPMVIIIVITLVATHERMSAVPARISNIFGLHSVDSGNKPASASL